MAHSSPKSIAVLGAGITGLTAAHRLVQRGHRVRLFEVTDRVGGAIRTELVDGWLIEKGPNSLLAGDPALAALIEELGLQSEEISTSPNARNRYILRRGIPLAVPLSPPGLLRTRLFSWGAKVRLLRELLTKPRVRSADVSLEEFARSHFGQEFVDYAVNPFVTGIYAGDPKKLSARYAFPNLWELEQSHGSLLRGQIAAAKARPPHSKHGIISFRQGLQVLPDALAARLPEGTLSFRARVQVLMPGAPWSVVWDDGTATKTEAFDAVIAALPAPALAQLRFGALGERPLASLDTIEHPPLSSVFLGYKRNQVAHALDGFGLLIPELERRSILGVLFSSTLFEGRAPAGYVALTVMIGGTRQPGLARMPMNDLVAAIEPDLQRLLRITGSPVFRRHAFWPRAIPQYNLGYPMHFETMAATQRAHPGFFLGGQARDGIALPACIAAGERLATQIEEPFK